MQSDILEANPTARLRVYAIWTNKLFGDARNRWDADDVAGDWLAGHVSGYQGGDWDTYLLFGPEATWSGRPGPLRSSGSPVDEQVGVLRDAVAPLLAAPP